MKVSDVLDQPLADRAYGEPYETADGVTVIPVAKPSYTKITMRFASSSGNIP